MFLVFNIRRIRKIFAVLLIFTAFIFSGIFAVRFFFPLDYIDIINKYAAVYEIEPSLVCAVINAESKFDINAVSEKGASGLMQVMRPTADWAAESADIENYSYDNIFDAELNINIGCWYLRWLMDRFDNNMTLVIAAYNAGGGNVNKWLYDTRYSHDGKELHTIPFNETDQYVKRVNFNKKVYDILLKFI